MRGVVFSWWRLASVAMLRDCKRTWSKWNTSISFPSNLCLGLNSLMCRSNEWYWLKKRGELKTWTAWAAMGLLFIQHHLPTPIDPRRASHRLETYMYDWRVRWRKPLALITTRRELKRASKQIHNAQLSNAAMHPSSTEIPCTPLINRHSHHNGSIPSKLILAQRISQGLAAEAA
jgi:hypothetical protein